MPDITHSQPLNHRAPLVFDTRDLPRRPGAMRTLKRTVPAPADLGLELRWQRAAVAGPHRLEPLPLRQAQRFEIEDPLAGQQALDPVGVPGLLRDQRRAGHKAPRLREVGKLVGLMEFAVFDLPAAQGGQALLQLRFCQ